MKVLTKFLINFLIIISIHLAQSLKAAEFVDLGIWEKNCEFRGKFEIINNIDQSRQNGQFFIWRHKTWVLLAHVTDQTDMFLKATDGESYILRFEKSLNRGQLQKWWNFKPKEILQISMPETIKILFDSKSPNWNKVSDSSWQWQTEVLSKPIVLEKLAKKEFLVSITDDVNHQYKWYVTKKMCGSVPEDIFRFRNPFKIPIFKTN